MSGFKTGFGAMREVIEASKAGQAGGGSSPGGYLSNYISWKAGERKVIRFLDNDPIIAEFYDWILTNDGKTKNFLIDPSKGDLVSKYASSSPGLGWRRDFISGNLEERKVSRKGVGLAVIRDEVPSTKGTTDVVDHFYDLELPNTGKTYRARYFGIIIQGLNNFWDQVDGFERRYGSITDRDYLIERRGAGLDTRYQVIPMEPIEELRDVEAVQKFYGYGKPWPKRPQDDATAKEKEEWEDRFLFCPQTLQQWAEDFSSDDRVKHWLTPVGGAASDTFSSPPPVVGTKSPTWSATTDEAQVAVSGDTDFSSLKKRLLENRD